MSRLTIELPEQSRNPKIRRMFTNNEAGIEIDYFVVQHHLELRKEDRSGEPAAIVLTGKLADLYEFIKTYLSRDAGRGVYTLEA